MSKPVAHPVNDEYNWKVYTQEYSHQVDEMERTAGDQGSEFLVTSWNVTDEGIEYHNKLHLNWRVMYSAIYDCKPASVFECGCGGMYHLKNIKTLFPDIKVSGCDLLQTQIDFGAKKFDIGEDILKNVSVRDFSEPVDDSLGKHDFVYSHAVMMHVSKEKGIKFFANMLKLSNKYVAFIEGPQHDYIKMLDDLGETDNWDVKELRTNSWLLTKKDK